MSAPTITEFLTTRYDEWEQAAREATEPDLTGRRTFYGHIAVHADDWGLHLFHVPPAQILALVAALRAVVEVHVQHRYGCAECGEPDGHWPCYTVAKLAAAFAGHPDYDEGWRA